MTELTRADRKACCDAIVAADHQLDHCKRRRDADALVRLITALNLARCAGEYLEFADDELGSWLSLDGDYVRVVLQGDRGFVIANGQLRQLLGPLGAQAMALGHSRNVTRLEPIVAE